MFARNFPIELNGSANSVFPLKHPENTEIGTGGIYGQTGKTQEFENRIEGGGGCSLHKHHTYMASSKVLKLAVFSAKLMQSLSHDHPNALYTCTYVNRKQDVNNTLRKKPSEHALCRVVFTSL